MPFEYDDFKFKGKIGHVERNVLHRLNFERVKLPKIEQDKFGIVASTQHTVVTKIADQVNEMIYELLYQAYKDTDCDEIIVLDKTEFKRFINMFLPKYIELIRKESK